MPNVLDVFKAIGCAVWQIQVLEGSVAAYLVLVYEIEPTTARAQAEALLAGAERRTLGRLHRTLAGKNGVPGDLLDRLEGFVDERNWLVHRSRGESRELLKQPEGVAELLERVNRAADDALSLAGAFTAQMEASLTGRGLSRDEIDSRAAQILTEWGWARAGE